MTLPWTPRTSAQWVNPTTPNNTPNAVCWSPALAIFLAVGAGTANLSAALSSSPDGDTWTDITPTGLPTTFNDSILYDVCWSPALGLFLACGNDNTLTAGSPVTNTLWTSPDGTAWTGRGIPTNLNRVITVCWSPDLALFVAGGFGTGASRTPIATSPDGVTWTSRATGWGTHLGAEVFDICWSPDLGLFCAVGEEGTFGGGTGRTVLTSPDGLTWTAQATPIDGSATAQILSVCWNTNQGQFVARGVWPSHNQTVLTSPDGVTWTVQTTALDSTTAGPISTGGNLVISGEHAQRTLSETLDGVTWATVSVYPFQPYDIAYSFELDTAVAVGDAATASNYAIYSAYPVQPAPPRAGIRITPRHSPISHA